MEFFDKTKQCDFAPVGDLRLIQTDYLFSCRCDVRGCFSQARAMHTDDNLKAFIVCLKHQIEGVESGLLKPIPTKGINPLAPPVPIYFGE